MALRNDMNNKKKEQVKNLPFNLTSVKTDTLTNYSFLAGCFTFSGSG